MWIVINLDFYGWLGLEFKLYRLHNNFIFTREGNHVLAKETIAISIWSVTENVDGFKHWDNLYYENAEAIVSLLKKLVDEWKDHSLKLSSWPSDSLTLKQTMKGFRLKNNKTIIEGGANASLYKEADKFCKVI